MKFRNMRKWIMGGMVLSIILLFWNTNNPLSMVQGNGNLQSLPGDIHKKVLVPPLSTRRLPLRRMSSVNCADILKGDKTEIQKAKELMKAGEFSRSNISDREYIRMAGNCNNFKNSRDYNVQPSKSEQEFPIAYSILLYKEVEQAERLLRAIYTPNNLFCLHVDADANPVVHQAIQAIADCFDNVFIASKKEYIIYAGFSRLQADLNCMDNLLQRGKSWKYFINLPSQQFPIKTNVEIVNILRTYNGSNDIEGITGQRKMAGRYQFRHIYKITNNHSKAKLVRTNMKKDAAPHNITVIKGSAYGIFSRAFVEFIHTSRVAHDLLDWFRDVNSPDEYYWATLHHNPKIGTPGAYAGKPDDKEWMAVYAAWGGRDPCAGKFVRGVCVFGVADLPGLANRQELFVNKFHLDFQPLAMDCMEEWHLNRTAVASIDHFNGTFYSNLKFVSSSHR